MSYRIISKFIKDISFEIPDAKSFVMLEKEISNYSLNFDIKSKPYKDNIIEVNSREVHCDDDHPLVYYVIPTETNSAVCGYCNRTFVYIGE